MAGGHNSTAHQLVDLIDLGGLVVDCELPTGIKHIGEHDEARRLEVGLEHGPLRRRVADRDLLGFGWRAVRELRTDLGDVVAGGPGELMRIKRNLGVVYPVTVICVEDFFDRRAARCTREPNGALDRAHAMHDPCTRKLLFISHDPIVFGLDPLPLLILAAGDDEPVRLGVDESSLVEEGGRGSRVVFPAVGKEGQDEVPGVPEVEAPAGVVDDLVARLDAEISGGLCVTNVAWEACEEPLVVVELGDADRVRVLDALVDTVFGLERAALPGDEIAQAVRRRTTCSSREGSTGPCDGCGMGRVPGGHALRASMSSRTSGLASKSDCGTVNMNRALAEARSNDTTRSKKPAARAATRPEQPEREQSERRAQPRRARETG